MNPWLVIDAGYSMWYDGMDEDETEVWVEDPDEEEFEEPEFRLKRIVLHLRAR